MPILKLMHKPTQVHISKLARENCRKLYGDDFAALMLESVKNLEQKTQKRPTNSILNRIINKIRPQKEMTINISSNENKDFLVNSSLKIGLFDFISKPKKFDIAETLTTLKNFKSTVEQTKDDVLKQLEEFNRLKKNFTIRMFK